MGSAAGFCSEDRLCPTLDTWHGLWLDPTTKARCSYLVAVDDKLLQLMAEHALHDVHAVRLCYLHNTLDEVVASARSHGVQAS